MGEALPKVGGEIIERASARERTDDAPVQQEKEAMYIVDPDVRLIENKNALARQELIDQTKDLKKQEQLIRHEKNEAHAFFQGPVRVAFGSKHALREGDIGRFEHAITEELHRSVADCLRREGLGRSYSLDQEPIIIPPDTQVTFLRLNEGQKKILGETKLTIPEMVERGMVSIQIETLQRIAPGVRLDPDLYEREATLSRIMVYGRYGDPQMSGGIRYEVMSGVQDPTESGNEKNIPYGVLHEIKDEKDVKIFTQLFLDYHGQTLEMYKNDLEHLRLVLDGTQEIVQSKERVEDAIRVISQYPDTHFALAFGWEVQDALAKDEIGYLDRFVRANKDLLQQVQELSKMDTDLARKTIVKILNEGMITVFAQIPDEYKEQSNIIPFVQRAGSNQYTNHNGGEDGDRKVA